MKAQNPRGPSVGTRSAVLLIALAAVGGGLAAWKNAAAQGPDAGAQQEPAEVVTAAIATPRDHQSMATSIGTVLATRSISLRNEVPGTVRFVRLVPGQVVAAGAVLVALDVSVEEAELRALQAQAQLTESTLARVQRLYERQAMSAIELDNARAERDVARAQIARLRAVIARKTIHAPFRARVGISDVHAGQFLDAGTVLTTLQGVDDVMNVDFAVAQDVAAGLRPGQPVQLLASDTDAGGVEARITAVDARIDPTTRNAIVRARVAGGQAITPGGSVRVRVPVGAARSAVAIPVSALRKGPGGDHVFVLEEKEGTVRAHERSVQAGAVVGEQVIVLGGLRAGERVAASGSFKLREGALVRVDAGAAAPAAGGR